MAQISQCFSVRVLNNRFLVLTYIHECTINSCRQSNSSIQPTQVLQSSCQLAYTGNTSIVSNMSIQSTPGDSQTVNSSIQSTQVIQSSCQFAHTGNTSIVANWVYNQLQAPGNSQLIIQSTRVYSQFLYAVNASTVSTIVYVQVGYTVNSSITSTPVYSQSNPTQNLLYTLTLSTLLDCMTPLELTMCQWYTHACWGKMKLERLGMLKGYFWNRPWKQDTKLYTSNRGSPRYTNGMSYEKSTPLYTPSSCSIYQYIYPRGCNISKEDIYLWWLGSLISIASSNVLCLWGWQ